MPTFFINNLLIVEDHPLYLEKLSEFITTNFKVNKINTADCCSSALKVLSKQNFDLAIIDINLPDSNGIEVIRKIRKRKYSTKIITNSAFYDTFELNELLKLYTEGILLKGEKTETIKQSINKVLRDEIFYSEKILNAIDFVKNHNQVVLTKTEKIIANEICKGKTTKEISTFLKKSENTVCFHKKNIYKKLKINSSVSLVNIVTKMNWFK